MQGIISDACSFLVHYYTKYNVGCVLNSFNFYDEILKTRHLICWRVQVA